MSGSAYLKLDNALVKPLKSDIHQITPKRRVRTLRETQYISITKINHLILYRKYSLFILRIIRNTQAHRVDKMQSSCYVQLPLCFKTLGQCLNYVLALLLANESFHCQYIYHRNLLMAVMGPQVKTDSNYFLFTVVSDGLFVR